MSSSTIHPSKINIKNLPQLKKNAFIYCILLIQCQFTTKFISCHFTQRVGTEHNLLFIHSFNCWLLIYRDLTFPHEQALGNPGSKNCPAGFITFLCLLKTDQYHHRYFLYTATILLHLSLFVCHACLHLLFLICLCLVYLNVFFMWARCALSDTILGPPCAPPVIV